VSQETTSIAVCATAAPDLETLVRVVRHAGGWGIVPIQWPNNQALEAARHTAHAFVLHSKGACSELVESLGARPPHLPLIVVGEEPAPRAAPNLWLPALPRPALLATVINQLLAEDDSPSASGISIVPSWRRKSDMIIGSSVPIRQLLHSLDQLAPAQTPVLITGESGVGKELVARALHFCGPRAKEPFIAVNCAAIPENLFEAELFGYQRGAFTGAVAAHAGAFEAAHKGTLFLDEIGEMPPSMQPKLLRVLESSEVQRVGSTERKKVNFRLVTATNRNLEKEVKEGRFREDLYYRVQVYPVHVPPLRERPEDIPQLITHHLSIIATRENRPSLRLTSAALEKLISYRWPGNVRELVNLLERSVLLSENRVIDAQHITFPSQPGGNAADLAALLSYKDAKSRFEREYFSNVLRTASGNISLAAKLAQKTRKEIYDAVERCGLDVDDFAPRGRK
jgi:transcriptional regulator with GAF, ATPase, and Fis domain